MGNKMSAAVSAPAPVLENQTFCPMPAPADQQSFVDGMVASNAQFMPMMPMGMYPMVQMMPMMDPSAYAGMPNMFIDHSKASAEPKSRAQVMERVYSCASQRERIHWTVDSRKLKSTDREAVSPTFNVTCGGELDF